MTGLVIASLLLAPAQRMPGGAADAQRAEPAPTLAIDRAAAPIAIDGELSDPGWTGAARTADFTEFNPEENARPPARTEVVLAYDDDHLYVGFIAHGEPADIRATLSHRDEVFSEDVVGILIDTYGDAAWGYFLMANPHGVQADLRFTSRGEDASFDILYESAGRITDAGFVVEMAIPFTSLRFPDRPRQTWRINLYRNMPRASRHQMAWARLDRDDSCILCQSGTLTGIQGVSAGGTLEILPSVVAHRSGALADAGDPASGFRNGDVEGEASVGLRYAFPNGLTVEGTYNPDFSQVEADAAQMDVNRTFALSYPERRPFFQEGSDLYDTYLPQVYTRSINAPVVAGKLTGRLGRTSIAYIGAFDEHTPYVLPFEERSALVEGGESVSNIVRVRRNLYRDSYVGALVTDRRTDGGSGTTVGVDARLRLGTSYVVRGQIVASRTREPDDADLTDGLDDLEFGYGDGVHTAAFDGEAYRGRASYLSVSRQADGWSFDIAYRDATPTFRAENGFQTRVDSRRATAWTGFDFYPDIPGVDRVSSGVGAGVDWNFDGVRKARWLEPSVDAMLAGQTFVSLGLELGEERFRDIDFDGMRRVAFHVNSDFSDPVTLGFHVSRGSTIARNLEAPALGTGTSAAVWGRFKPIPRVIIEPEISYAALERADTGDRVYEGYIARSRFSVQFTRRFSLRLVTQYDDFSGAFDVDPLLTYRLNPYSVFYLGSTHDFGDFGEPAGLAETERQVFLKFQYLFRR